MKQHEIISGKKLSCTNCGSQYSLFPPDDVHPIAKLTKCEEGDSIEITYECDNCHHPNTIHWDSDHWHVV